MTFMIKADSASLSASGSDSLSINVAEGKTFTINKILVDSTGTFNITDIRDTQSGQHYLSGTVTSDMMKRDGNGTTNISFAPIVIRGSSRLIVDVTDTSAAANTVRIGFMGNEE